MTPVSEAPLSLWPRSCISAGCDNCEEDRVMGGRGRERQREVQRYRVSVPHRAREGHITLTLRVQGFK